MAPINNDSEKDTYKLWWEFLKRSEGYKSFCKTYHARIGNPLFHEYYSHDVNDRKTFEDKQTWRSATCFGDVFNDSFEDWWERFSTLKQDEATIVTLFDHEIEDFVHNLTTREKKKKFTAGELISSMKKYLDDSRSPYVYLRIDADKFTKDNISDIKKIIRTKRTGLMDRRKMKRLGVSNANYYRPAYFLPTSRRVRHDELQRYLRVFDLRRNKIKWETIFTHIYPKKSYTENQRRALLADLQKAKTIIGNVEKGEFPGKY